MAPRCTEATEWASFLPDDLIEDIFMRMPAKSVQRCRCLSRAWAAALSSRSFIDRHLRAANRHGRSPKLFFLPDYDSDDTTVHAWSPGRPLAVVRRDERLRRVAVLTRQCRGLVVLEARGNRSDMQYVCNPSTGQITALPEGKRAFGEWPVNHENYGIGYDAGIQKYKVVRLYCRGDLPPACEVYVLDSNGHWRSPTGAAGPPCWATNYCTDLSVFAHGHVYWPAQPHRVVDHQMVIMSFSISDEVFGILSPPPVRTYHCRLTELHGRLCLFNNGFTGELRRSYGIWLLCDHRAGAWDLHCRVDLDTAPLAEMKFICASGVTPLGSVDDGSPILLRSDHRVVRRDFLGPHRLFVYRPAIGDVQDFLVGDDMITHQTMTRRVAAPYEESLESTGRAHEDIIFSSVSSQALVLVLQRLPARTLGQLKCVCRSWCAMIESDRFVELHYKETVKSSPIRVVFSSLDDNRQFASLQSCLNDESVVSQLELLQRRVVSSKPCHGLLLVSYHCGGARVCNPVTGARVDHNNLSSGEPWTTDATCRGCIGLGYDLSRREHVIVVLAYTLRSFRTRSCAMECTIRRLTHCETRVIPPPSIPVTVDVPPVYAGGKMYWMGEPRLGTGCSEILVFDICNEAFDVVPAPRENDGSGGMLMAELGGQICVAHTCPNTETMTIWSKQEQDTFYSRHGWTRAHLIQLGQWPEFSPKTAAGLVIPLAVNNGGRILLDTGRALGYYDPRNQRLETVFSLSSLYFGDCSSRFFSVALCEDSLVRPV